MWLFRWWSNINFAQSQKSYFKYTRDNSKTNPFNQSQVGHIMGTSRCILNHNGERLGSARI